MSAFEISNLLFLHTLMQFVNPAHKTLSVYAYIEA